MSDLGIEVSSLRVAGCRVSGFRVQGEQSLQGFGFVFRADYGLRTKGVTLLWFGLLV